MAARVLIVVHSYYLRDTRPRRHAAILSRAGVQVDVLCARDAGEAPRETIGGVHIRRLPARRRRGGKLRYLFEYVMFAKLAFWAIALRRVRYDAVIVIGIPNFLIFSAMPAKRRGARLLLDMRDPLAEFFRAKYGIREGSRVDRLLLREEGLSCRRADAVLTVVPSMAKLYERSVPSEKVTVVWNAPDTRLFTPHGSRRDPSDRTMLYAGTVAPRYGVDLAVRAVAALRDEIPNIGLRIVGDGDLVATCRRLATELGVADRVEFHAPVPLEQVPSLVATAWLGVQPNRHDALMEHSLSTKILEWAALGLPVVAGRTRPLAYVFGEDAIWLHAAGNLEDLCRCLREAHAGEGVAARLDNASAAAARIDFEAQARALLEAVLPGHA